MCTLSVIRRLNLAIVFNHSDLDMDDAAPLPDLFCLPSNFIVMVLKTFCLRDRFTCALVCKTWAEAASAATRSIALGQKMQDLSCLQRWLEQHGNQLEVLQLHTCESAVLTALPQLQNLLLSGSCSISGSVWSNIAAATKLTSVSLKGIEAPSSQAEVVSALAALPDLKQLVWSDVACGGQLGLTDSMLLQKLTKLTALRLDPVTEAEALDYLGLLTRLQDFGLAVTKDWAAAGCPGLRELKALTRVVFLKDIDDIPDSVSQLTALQQLVAARATPTALNRVQGLTGLTYLCVFDLDDISLESAPLQLLALQHLIAGYKSMHWYERGTMPMLFLSKCTQLRVLQLNEVSISPGSLAASTMLQHLELWGCEIGWYTADPVSWQQVFPGPGRLPHLTSLKLDELQPDLQQADIDFVVACCSNLQVLSLANLHDNFASALACLPGLTSLTLWTASDQQCSSLAQLTGLRELRVGSSYEMSAAGLRHLAALGQLTCLGLNSFDTPIDVLKQYMPYCQNPALQRHP